jgi:hypothetical protein
MESSGQARFSSQGSKHSILALHASFSGVEVMSHSSPSAQGLRWQFSPWTIMHLASSVPGDTHC